MTSRVSARLRNLVRRRAGGRCEYCLLPDNEGGFPHQPDHILARKHDGPTTIENLAWACFTCNLLKGPETAAIDVPTGRAIRLFNPRIDVWTDHFRLERGEIIPLTPEGRVTARILRLNRPDLVEQRRMLIAKGRYH